MNLLKYLLLRLLIVLLLILVVSLLIYGYLMINNPRKEKTLYDRHQYAFNGIFMFYFYLPAMIYSYL